MAANNHLSLLNLRTSGSLADQFNRERISRLLGDPEVIIGVAGEDQIYHVHGMVLGHSPYFRERMMGNLGNLPLTIIVHEFSGRMVGAVLDYMYGNRVDITQNELPEFLKAANYFGLQLHSGCKKN